MPRRDLGFTAGELRRLRALRTPRGVQRALDAMPYHIGSTAWAPRRVLSEWTAHCLEGAVFAAAALRVLGFPPLLLDLEAVQDTDHVIAQGIWEHDKIDDNGAAHLEAALLGPSETVPIRGGRLLLGTWQGIALVECDGPREREIVVDIRV